MALPLAIMIGMIGMMNKPKGTKDMAKQICKIHNN
jgi:hypothetical protein